MITRSLRCGILMGAAMLVTSLASAQTRPEPWAAKDTQGRPVAVPADKTSVLLFVRPDQPQSKKAIEQVAALLKNSKDAQAIAIVSGDEAPQAAAKLKDAWPWAIFADPQYAASGKYAVRVWPTTVVISKDGSQAAHIGGFPASYAKDLDAYVAFASGKIDKAALEKRLDGHDVVADSAEQKAARHVEVAQRLAEKGATEEASAELAKAIEFKSTDMNLQLAIARTHLMLNQAPAADAIIAKLDPAAAPPAELNLLKGWSALRAKRFTDAEKLLTEATKLNPQPAEACYLLGLVYQQLNDSAKAAENFRKAFEHTPAGRSMGKP